MNWLPTTISAKSLPFTFDCAVIWKFHVPTIADIPLSLGINPMERIFKIKLHGYRLGDTQQLRNR